MLGKIRYGLAATILFIIVAMPITATAQSGNLLRNPSFEHGWHHQDGIPELAVPNEWWLHYLDGSGFNGIAEGYVARRPEAVVWPRSQAPAWEQSQFWIDGEYNVKLFKPWAPVYFGLSQDVTGLVAGRQYDFVARVYVDVVDYYSAGNKIPPSNEPDGVGIRLGASTRGAGWLTPQVGYGGFATAGNTSPFHQSYVTLRHRFTATASEMTVWVEMYSRYGYSNNGFFLDHFELYPAGGGGSVVSAPTATPHPTSTPRPQATPVPAATAAPAPSSGNNTQYTFYTVVSGDTLSKISRRFGVSMADIARVNDITNWSVIFVGMTLRIPVSGGVQPLPTPVGQTASDGPPPAATPTGPIATNPPPVTDGSGTTHVVQPGDRVSKIAQLYDVPYQLLVSVNNLTNPSLIYPGQVLVIPSLADYRTHKVVSGDRLAKIAEQYGVSMEAIIELNGLRDANFIYIGQVLLIPN